jgi:CRP-like cAMP-binding protein
MDNTESEDRLDLTKRIGRKDDLDSVVDPKDLDFDIDIQGRPSETFLSTLKSGQYFGELAVTGRVTTRVVSAWAASNCHFFRLSKNVFN